VSADRRSSVHAITQSAYGGPDGLTYREVATPTPGGDEVLVDVNAASVNAADWHFMRGEAYVMRLASGLRKPKNPVRGLDVAGRVEAVGDDVTEFSPGDAVFGEGEGTFAEYALAEEGALAPKPPSLSFDEAAAVPVAGVTALQGLRDVGEVTSGQRVLVNGASGGVGTFAVQVALAFDADVDGVCSTGNVEMVESLGASHVFDYTKDDFTRSGRRYDVVFDLVGNRSLSEFRRVLAPDGTLVLSSGEGGRWFGPAGTILKALVVSPFVGQRLRPLVASVGAEDLRELTDLIEDGAVEPVIDRTYPLRETPEAMRYVEDGHARGKVVIAVGDDDR